MYWVLVTEFEMITYLVDHAKWQERRREIDRMLESTTRSDGAPAWWHGPEEAARLGLMAARERKT